jgi:hypothetical protein
VVQAHQVQDRRVEVVDVDAVLHSFGAVIVGQAVSVAATNAAACQPDDEGIGVVVASGVCALWQGRVYVTSTNWRYRDNRSGCGRLPMAWRLDRK